MSQTGITVIFHIYINGKDVCIKTTDEAAENKQGTNNPGEMRLSQAEQLRRGGGKKPPYGLPPDFFDRVIDDDERETP